MHATIYYVVNYYCNVVTLVPYYILLHTWVMTSVSLKSVASLNTSTCTFNTIVYGDTLQIISGHRFPKPRGSCTKGSITDPYVLLEIFGLRSDCANARTKTVPGNGQWMQLQTKTVPGNGQWMLLQTKTVPGNGQQMLLLDCDNFLCIFMVWQITSQLKFMLDHVAVRTFTVFWPTGHQLYCITQRLRRQLTLKKTIMNARIIPKFLSLETF